MAEETKNIKDFKYNLQKLKFIEVNENKLINFDNCQKSLRVYGGSAGRKNGIIYIYIIERIIA